VLARHLVCVEDLDSLLCFEAGFVIGLWWSERMEESAGLYEILSVKVDQLLKG